MESVVYWFKSKTASMIFEVTQRQSQYSWGGQKFIFWFLIVMWSSCFLKRPQKMMKSSWSIWHYLTGLLQGGARGLKPPPTPLQSYLQKGAHPRHPILQETPDFQTLRRPYVVDVKSLVKISKIFVAFSENVNFNKLFLQPWKCMQLHSNFDCVRNWPKQDKALC